jgi:hypothetical protein
VNVTAWASGLEVADDGTGIVSHAGLGLLRRLADKTGLTSLRNDFCVDALSQLCPEWRLRRGVILRWVRGWYAERGLTSIPSAAIDLPVIEPRRNKRRPTGPEGTAP